MLTVKPARGTLRAVKGRAKTLFAEWLETHRSPNTRDAYGRDVAAFAQWYAGTGPDPLQVGSDDLDRYRDECLAAGVSPATVARRLSSIASFLRFAAEAGAVASNAAAGVERPAVGAGGPVTLSDDEVTSLLDAADGLGPKTSALVSLLALEGMRLGEVLAIDVPRVRVDGPRVSVSIGRRGSDGDVDVSARTAAAVTAYLAGRRRGPLFLGQSAVAAQPSRLSRFGADFLIKRAGSSAGIEKSVSANVLRRSYMESAHRAGASIAAISRHVGHRELRETARMLDVER
jgi:integrase/recombinase XerD